MMRCSDATYHLQRGGTRNFLLFLRTRKIKFEHNCTRFFRNLVMSDRVIKSIGHYGFYGFSGTFDFVEALSRSQEMLAIDASGEATTDSTNAPIRILLVHPADIRYFHDYEVSVISLLLLLSCLHSLVFFIRPYQAFFSDNRSTYIADIS